MTFEQFYGKELEEFEFPSWLKSDWTPPAGPNPSIIHQISILEAYKAGKIIEWSCNEIAWNTQGPKTPFNFGLRWYRVKAEI